MYIFFVYPMRNAFTLMDSNYTTATDLLLDDSFCAYCLGTDPTATRQWEQWLQQHPEQNGMFREAVALFHTLNTTDTSQQAAFDAFETMLKQHSHTPVISIKRTSYKRLICIAAACLAGVVMVGAAYWLTGRKLAPQLQAGITGYDTIYTRKGEQKKLTLPDNSTAILNYNSRLIIPHNFGKVNRQLQLQGEAIFDVQPDAVRPFTVTTGAVDVTVLGTVFNVSSYPQHNRAVVTVLQGKVGVKNTAGKDSVTLLPNQQAIYNAAGIQHRNADASLALSWQNGKIRFQQEDLQTIAFTLENKFNINIRFLHPEIAQELYTASFDADMKLEEIARVLCIGRNIQYAFKNNELWFSYK